MRIEQPIIVWWVTIMHCAQMNHLLCVVEKCSALNLIDLIQSTLVFSKTLPICTLLANTKIKNAKIGMVGNWQYKNWIDM